MIKGIYDENDKKDPVYIMNFEDIGDGTLCMKVTDNEGNACKYGDLLLINGGTGIMTLNPCIDPELGFDLTDENGKFKGQIRR